MNPSPFIRGVAVGMVLCLTTQPAIPAMDNACRVTHYDSSAFKSQALANLPAAASYTQEYLKPRARVELFKQIAETIRRQWTQPLFAFPANLIHLGPSRLHKGVPLDYFGLTVYFAATIALSHYYFHKSFEQKDLSERDRRLMHDLILFTTMFAAVGTLLLAEEMENQLGLGSIESLFVVVATVVVIARLYFVIRPVGTPLIRSLWIRVALHLPFLLLAAQWWFGILDHALALVAAGGLAATAGLV